MKLTSYLISCLCLLMTAQSFAQNLKSDKNLAKVLKTVKPEDLEAHVKYLADDRLLGRLPGTPGYQMAMDYVIDQFKAVGVEPAGENNSFLQQVRLRKAFTDKNATIALLDANGKEEALQNGKDFILYPHFENPEVSVQAPLVFVGSGISAPELGYDDYAGLDVSGKMVVIRRGAPQKFPSSVAASSMNLATILKTALDHGAVGVIIGSGSVQVRELKGVNGIRFPDGKMAPSGSYISDKIKLLSLLTAHVLIACCSKLTWIPHKFLPP